jgi:hypothetical protein
MTTIIDGTAVSTFGAGITCTSTNEAVHTEAAHATTSDIWAGGQTCLLSGSAVTFTDIADAPVAGAVRTVIANAAHIITGNANYTCSIGDLLRFEAKSTTAFRVSVMSHGTGIFGYQQSWSDVSGSRAANTTYTNNTGRPIQVNVFGGGGNGLDVSLTVGSVLVSQMGGDGEVAYHKAFVSATVPAGSTYIAQNNGNTLGWAELR